MVAAEAYIGAALATNAIWTLLDQRRYDDILTYLTPDCAWERMEGWRHGHDEVRASFDARPSDLFTRHVVSNLTVELVDEGKLKGRCYVVCYAARTDDHEAIHLSGHPMIIADADLQFVQVEQRVFISKISVHQTFAIRELIK
ncbi:nuclear transport factor 2 family protein [Sphingobium sp.]|uniref:nuclear transport factor 2 family protein n=1 Tax=Sphingobium sp. TaxID=1912891 RepID=UPI0028BD79C0|nr:nuclear transport factor 2 family protein [Sphingobium sp.]